MYLWNNYFTNSFLFLQCVYTDIFNRRIFTTIDHSLNIKSTKLSFVPSEVSYRPDIPFVFIIHDKVSPTKQVCMILFIFIIVIVEMNVLLYNLLF